MNERTQRMRARMALWGTFAVLALVAACGGGSGTSMGGDGPGGSWPSTPLAWQRLVAIDSRVLNVAPPEHGPYIFPPTNGLAADPSGSFLYAFNDDSSLLQVNLRDETYEVRRFTGDWYHPIQCTPANCHVTTMGVDGGGLVYVFTRTNRPLDTRVEVLSRNGVLLSQYVLHDTGQDTVVDRAGNVYVLNSWGVKKAQSDGSLVLLAGSADEGPIPGGADPARIAKDGQGAAAVFQYLFDTDPVMDAVGNMYVRDAGAIRKISPDGNVTTLAGKLNTDFDRWGPTSDGFGADARFAFPEVVGVLPDGRVMLCDRGMLRQIASDGRVTTLRAAESSECARFVQVGGRLYQLRTRFDPVDGAPSSTRISIELWSVPII